MKQMLTSLLMLFTVCSFSQTELIVKNTQPLPFIEVTGTAIKEIVPDKIFITITLTNKTIDKQPYTIETQEEKLKQALQNYKIDLAKLSLSDMSSEITKYRKRESLAETKKELVLEVNTAEQVATVFKALNALNIKEASITKLEHSKIDSLRKDVRIAAIKAAKDKAEYLTTAIGETIGKALEIREQTEQPYYQENRNLGMFANTNMSYNVAVPTETSFDKIKISFSYYIKYTIK